VREIIEDKKHPQRLRAAELAIERDGRIGQVITKPEDDGLITYEQLEIIVRKRQAKEGG
jgi:hypothetical protein